MPYCPSTYNISVSIFRFGAFLVLFRLLVLALVFSFCNINGKRTKFAPGLSGPRVVFHVQFLVVVFSGRRLVVFYARLVTLIGRFRVVVITVRVIVLVFLFVSMMGYPKSRSFFGIRINYFGRGIGGPKRPRNSTFG